MKKFFFAFAMVLIGNLSAQTPIYDTNRLYDIVTESDSCYLFPSFKPCFMPWRYDWAPSLTLIQEYVAADTVTVYGVAITMKNRVEGHPFCDDLKDIKALLMTSNGISPNSSSCSWTPYSMVLVDSVTLNRSHPRFCWFSYADTCGNYKPEEMPCYEFYFDTPQQINRVTDTFYVGRHWQSLNAEWQWFSPLEYGGEYNIAIPSTLFYSMSYQGDWLDWFSRCEGSHDRKWGVFFPIVGFRCGPIPGQCNLNIYTSDTVVASWRNAEQGILYNLRLVGEDGSDTTYITTDTTYTITNFSDSVRYEVMLRKQCRYCTTNYDTTVYGGWRILGSIGTTNGGGNDTTGGGGNQGIAQLTDGAYFTLNPNPAHESVQVLLPAAALGGRLTFCDLSGRELIVRTATSTSIEVDVSALPTGTYLVKLTTPAGTTVKKLLLR